MSEQSEQCTSRFGEPQHLTIQRYESMIAGLTHQLDGMREARDIWQAMVKQRDQTILMLRHEVARLEAELENSQK